MKTAWLIELHPDGGALQYFSIPGEWCPNANHATPFPTKAAAEQHAKAYGYPTRVQIKVNEHAWHVGPVGT